MRIIQITLMTIFGTVLLIAMAIISALWEILSAPWNAYQGVREAEISALEREIFDDEDFEDILDNHATKN